MSAAREKDQADFDLERFIDMFDEALTSQDERVVNALRSLMMMVILTKSDSQNMYADRNHGPLRRMCEDLNHINRRLGTIEEKLHEYRQQPTQWPAEQWPAEEYKYTLKDAQALAQKINSPGLLKK